MKSDLLMQVKELTYLDKHLLCGDFGLEREGLRVDSNGVLSFEKHPEIFGDKISNPYITTDFSESQIELITPAFNSCEETYNFLSNLYNIVVLDIKEDEYIWSQSMPCIIPSDKEIPIATYNEDSQAGYEARSYRELLMKKYGGKKQLISGIHYNFSFNEEMIKRLYENSNEEIEFKQFKDDVYLKMARNYLRYRWLILYLLGGTGVIHESYTKECVRQLEEVADGAFSNEGAVSYRNSECGYKNKVDLYPDYSSAAGYVKSINEYIENGIIESHKELYSSVRLKAKDNNNLLESIEMDGINYLEYRSIDINPFDKCGVSLDDLKFLQVFNIFLLLKEEQNYEKWQEEADENQNLIARYGHENIDLKLNGEAIKREAWSLDILEEIKLINNELSLGKENIIDLMIEKVKNYKLTYSYKIIEKVKNEGFVEAYMSLSKGYKKDAFNNRFRYIGYEAMELSTQILLKEAIKRGIKVEIIDESDNFISLEKNNKVEYVKQATKTSKDNYISVLMMENKVVTKKILEKAGIRIPSGMEFHDIEMAMNNADKFINKPIVIKPKSTNFGLGISIFNEGSKKEDIEKALNIAFKYDRTVLVEEFIEGKEYRFLVIGDAVAGILHRVPANVVGDGSRTITELVAEKNMNPLRGRGYKTPLEKINLDDNVDLFLKQSNKTVSYIPKDGEVVYLRENSNISTGGDSVDFTDDISEKFKKIAVDAAKAVGAKICGVDMIIKDYDDKNSSYGIIELNFNPAIHIHSYPYIGKEREIAKAILKLLELI